MESKKPKERLGKADLLERLKKAQGRVRAQVPSNVSLADELIAERREEARREMDSGSE